MTHRFVRCVAVFVCLASVFICFVGRSFARPSPAPPQSQSQKVVELRIDGEIEPILAEYLTAGIDAAAQEHASLILITMNTPGGLDSAMRAIIQKILTSPVPVVTYVYPTGSRAASAGFFILLSADVDAMAPGTDTGAASPLMEFGGSPVQIDATLRKKIVNEATAYLRSYVEKRGRNPELAATAVTDAKAFSEKEALEGKLIDMEAPNPDALLAQLNGRTITRFDGSMQTLDLSHPVIELREMNGRQRLLTRIVQPDMFFILLIIAVLGLYAEFTHPGLFAPGVIGGIALVLALYAMQLLPVNITGLVLIGLAIVFFILEAKFPTHGILGFGGALAMMIGALMLVKSPITAGGVNVSTALAVTVPVALIIIFLMRLVLRSRHWKDSTGAEQLVGEVGEIKEPVEAPGGKGMVFVHGELWRAVATQQIPRGARVRVKEVDGLTLQVEPVEKQVASS